MFAFAPYIIAIAGSAALAGFAGYQFGSDGANAECLEDVRDTAIEYAKGWQKSVEQVQVEVSKQSKRDIEHAKRQAIVEARKVKQKAEYEQLLQNRVEYRMPDDAFILLNNAIDTANDALGYSK